MWTVTVNPVTQMPPPHFTEEAQGCAPGPRAGDSSARWSHSGLGKSVLNNLLKRNQPQMLSRQAAGRPRAPGADAGKVLIQGRGGGGQAGPIPIPQTPTVELERWLFRGLGFDL